MSKDMFDVIVFGGACCDIIFSGFSALPGEGREVFAENMSITAGGAFIVAAAASRLGLKTALPLVLGADLPSAFLRQAAADEGISPELFLEDAGNCEQLTVVMNYGGERSFLSHVAGRVGALLQQHLQQSAREHPARVAVFGMSTHGGAPEMMDAMRQKGAVVVLDCSWDEQALCSDAFKRQIGLCDYFLPNLSEARKITGCESAEEAARELARLCPNVVVKVGEGGAVCFFGGKPARFPAPCYGPAVDTTGAGDNFVAGFSYGLAHAAPPEICVRYGLICGSRSVLGVGGFAKSLYEEELLELARQYA